MAFITEPVKKAFNSMTQNDKIADLQGNIRVADSKSHITTDFGVAQRDTEFWLKIMHEKQLGPALLEDTFGREQIHRFDHERIPERVVHARGVGAFGEFKLLDSAEDVTCARVLTDTSRTTPVFVRFSTVLGSRGSADTVRDVRGFAIKFYTAEGNWDLVGNDIPVFFINEAIKFPHLIHAGKPEPHNEVPQAQTAHNNFYDFAYLHEEATHMLLWALSDRGIPRSLRMIQGFGVNTFTLINSAGERSFVKFHWVPELGVHSLVWDEALKLSGQDPDFHRKDLEEAITSGIYPKWKFGFQVIPESKEHDFEFDILDATKLWPEDLVPVRFVGELVLNRNVDEYFTQTEQVAFCTSHIVPGIGFSDDPLLQGRNFSYFDTQLTRLGPNWQELPINRPVCPVMNFNRDGAMRHTISKGTINYWPNRHGIVPPASEGTETGLVYADFAARVSGIKTRTQSAKFKDHHSQAQLFYNSLSAIEKAHVIAALSFELDHCDETLVVERMIKRLTEIDYTLAQSVSEKVFGKKPDKHSDDHKNHGRRAPNISQRDFPALVPGIASRKVAILVANGFDYLAFGALKAALASASAIAVVIAPYRGSITASNGAVAAADHHLEGFRSTMVDAVFVPGGNASVKALAASGRAMHWIREAFGHLKTVGATGDAVDLVRSALALPELELSTDTQVVASFGVVTLGSVHAQSLEQTLELLKSAKGFVDLFFAGIAAHRNWERELKGLNARVAY